MLFNSLHFALFLPVVLLVYAALPHRLRLTFLLAASYYFYMAWEPRYAVLILISTVVDYVCGLRLEQAPSQRRRRGLLLVSLLSNLGLLFVFKYFNFFGDSINAVAAWLGGGRLLPPLDVLLPIGISFYTFQTLSYTIDVYRGRVGAERNFIRFALYVSFFPQLVAGPIERPGHLLPQFRERVRFDAGRFEDGLKLALWGFFKKLVIADRMAVYVNEVYGAAGSSSGAQLALATYFFAFQIYCDFSGYSDIAIGTSRMLGFDLMDNFHRPYLAKNIEEFWQRWHISLSTWFRDYLYIPLGGNRVGPRRWQFNLLVVFLVSGLWHGANWTFVIWGGLHGIYLIAFKWFRGLRSGPSGTHGRAGRALATVATFHLVLFAWIFFRAESFSHARQVIETVFSSVLTLDIALGGLRIEGFGGYQLLVSGFALGLLLLVERFGGNDLIAALRSRAWWQRWAFYYALILLILNFGMFHSPQEFIYYQF